MIINFGCREYAASIFKIIIKGKSYKKVIKKLKKGIDKPTLLWYDI